MGIAGDRFLSANVMNESQYRNAVFLVEAAVDELQRLSANGARPDEIQAAYTKLEEVKASLKRLLEDASTEDRRHIAVVLAESDL